MTWLVLAATAAITLLAAAGTIRGRWPVSDLPPAVTTTPLPMLSARPTPPELADLRFDTAMRGYDPQAVDERLEAWAAVLADSTRSAPTARPFRVRYRGYRMDQVDVVLDALERGGLGVPADLPGSGLGAPADPPVSVAIDPPAPAAAEPAPDDRVGIAGPPVRWRAVDVAVGAAYGLMATYVLALLVLDPRGSYLSQGVQDQQAFEWYFGATAHNLATLANPLASDLLNFPAGVNLMANASVMGLGVPLAPLTWVAGQQVTFVVVEWLGFTLTAFAWYALFLRRLALARPVALVGGALVGFSPAMVSHGNGHPNFVAQFLVPVILDRLVALHDDPGRWRRHGLVLGLLVTWQLWIGEEVLLLAAVGIALLGAALLVQGRVRLRGMVPGLAVGAGVAVVLFGFPLWWQFFGPGSYRHLWQPPGGNDLAALWGRATRTLGADPWAAAALSMNRTEENAFLGAGSWVLALAAVILLWRSTLVRACALVIVVTAWLSLGPQVLLNGRPVGLPALWGLVEQVPVIGNVLPSRFTLVTVPALATVLVLLLQEGARRRRRVPWAPWAAGAAVGLALAPMLPTPLIADPRPAVPAFFTTGAWRGHVADGSVLAVPPPDIVDMRAVDWQAAARWDFPLVEGYFMGPAPTGDGEGQRGATRRAFSVWLQQVDSSGQASVATAAQRATFLADLGAWRVDAVVLPVDRAHSDALRQSVETVLGPPARIGAVWVWDTQAVRTGA